MKTAEKNTTTNCLLVLVNCFAEHGSDSSMLKTDFWAIKSKIEKKYKVNLRPEDILQGEEASWEVVRDRMEEYLHLSYLRPGSLKVFYYSPVSDFFNEFNHDQNLINFYDCSVNKEQCRDLVNCFPESFKLSFEKIEICEPSSVNNIPMNLKSSAHYSLLKQTA